VSLAELPYQTPSLADLSQVLAPVKRSIHGGARRCSIRPVDRRALVDNVVLVVRFGDFGEHAQRAAGRRRLHRVALDQASNRLGFRHIHALDTGVGIDAAAVQLDDESAVTHRE